MFIEKKCKPAMNSLLHADWFKFRLINSKILHRNICNALSTDLSTVKKHNTDSCLAYIYIQLCKFIFNVVCTYHMIVTINSYVNKYELIGRYSKEVILKCTPETHIPRSFPSIMCHKELIKNDFWLLCTSQQDRKRLRYRNFTWKFAITEEACLPIILLFLLC